MGKKAPGRADRQGMSLVEAVKLFSDEDQVTAMFIEARWPNGVACPNCGSLSVAERTKPQPFRCRDCRKDFSVKTGTVMQSSNLPLSKWAIAAYLMTTNLKGVSSMKIHRDLGITQKTAWHLGHRIRKAWEANGGLFVGPVEVDETYVGGRDRNRHADKKLHVSGTVGKTPVVGVKDRDTNQISSAPVEDTKKETLEGFISERVSEDALIYTDDHPSYGSLPRHVTVSHSTGEYVRGLAHTNGIEGHWAMLKRGIMGTYHHISPKHLHRYATEFDGRHNDRPSDTLDQVKHIMKGMVGKRLRYDQLLANTA